MNQRWRLAQFFEIRWWRRYLARRDKTEYLNWKRQYWLDFLQKSGLEISPNSTVLDAGCGPAGIFTALENKTIDALDPLLDEYENTLPHFRRSDYPQVRFFNTPLEFFFPDKKYDFVFCLNALNHVADLSLCLNRLAELTKPGGTLAVSVDAHNHAWLKKAFRLAPADILHPHQFDLEEYRAMLTAQGFQIQKKVLIKKEAIFNYYLLVAKKP
jgi:2-polyprenyl-6-hydroxyphenyl methylase/3-demethylubiquinone-9 3-methyltransferase